MEVIFSSAPLPALPSAAFGINVNFCKNPHCPNFGVPADIVKHRHKKGALASAGSNVCLARPDLRKIPPV